MPWPTPQEYNEAVQDPGRCFADPELRGGAPDLTPLGLPRPVTGNFASVYRLRRGRSEWAVRCFFRAPDDLAKRYAAISSALNDAGLPCTVGFAYVDRGILVGGRWYPILKMAWAEGDLLTAWVGRNLERPRELRAMAGRWRRMADSLEGRGIAHGDLQHGNILVSGGKPLLVDYDGMYVPALDGSRAPELGHPNFQHPARGAHHFGPTLDRFSSWLICGSLLVLAGAPDLWDGDDCLILRGSDLRDPDRSPVFARLRRHQCETARAFARQMERLLTLEPDHLPPLSELPPAPPRNTGPDWLRDHVSQPPAFAVGYRRRASLVVTALPIPALVVTGNLLPAACAAIALLLLPLLLFAADPLVADRVRLFARVQRRQVELRLVTRRRDRLRARRRSLESRHQAELERALARKRLLALSRYPGPYKTWRTARLDRRIRTILARHAILSADLAARDDALAAQQRTLLVRLTAARKALEQYETVDLSHFVRALYRFDRR